MEFKFRAVDDRPPPLPQFSEPPLPLPFPSTMPCHSVPFPETPSSFPSVLERGDFRPYPSAMRNRDITGDQAMRELEKDQIMEEIIMSEIARRRELEAEVRQEIMFLEREMARRRAARTGGFALGDSFAPMWGKSRPPLPPLAHPFGDRLVPMLSSSSPSPLLGHSSVGEPNVLPLAPLPEDVTSDLKASTEPNNDKLIVLAKPDPNLCTTKRKAVDPPALDANELRPFGLKKKPNEEWSCALCHVRATTEIVWNDHLRGKKHMAKEAKLNSQNASALIQKKPTSSSAYPEPEAKVEAQMPEKNMAAHVSKKKKLKKINLELKNSSPTKRDTSVGGLKNTGGSETVVQANGAMKKKSVKMFKYWCEMCRVGSVSSLVMEEHKKGKKHMNKLHAHEYRNGDGAASKTIEISSEANVLKPEVTDVLTALISIPETSDEAFEPKKSDKVVSEITCITSEPSVPNASGVNDSNKTDEAAWGGILLKDVVTPKPEDPAVGFESNKSNKAFSNPVCVSSNSILSIFEVARRRC